MSSPPMNANKPPLAPKTPPLGPASVAKSPLIPAAAATAAPVNEIEPLPTAVAVADAEVDVPLIEPRFPRRARGHKEIRTTSSGAALSEGSTSDTLGWRSSEKLTVRCGQRQFHEDVDFKTYALFKNGNTVHSRAVGYSSDGDLVLQREERALQCRPRSKSLGGNDSDSSRPATSPQLKPVVSVTGAVCLNPKAKPPRPHTDTEALPSAATHVSAYYKRRKYPGVKCPKNRKIRNRLMNDHMATYDGRKVHDAAEEHEIQAGIAKEHNVTAFPAVPKAYEKLVHCSEREESSFLSLRGIVPPPRNDKTVDKDSAQQRFLQLSQRLKGELSHAMTTDYMPLFLTELDEKFTDLIKRNTPTSPTSTPGGVVTPESVSTLAESADADSGRYVDIQCRDGYGRLMTHAVASFYKLVSNSRTLENGDRVTRVEVPKVSNRKKDPLKLPSMPLTKFLTNTRERSPSPGADDEKMPPPPPKQSNASRTSSQRRSSSAKKPTGSPTTGDENNTGEGRSTRTKRFKKKVHRGVK